MKDNNLEYLLTAIKRSQDKYVHSQIDLFDRILVQVKKQYENAMSATMCNEVAIAIYQGYILSDIEDAVRNGQFE